MLTSKKDFEAWGSVLGDEVMAAVLHDRVPHHWHIVSAVRSDDEAFAAEVIPLLG